MPVAEYCKKYKDFIKSLIWGLILLMVSSCGGGDSLSKNPYCEFVDGNYTFDIDLRRSLFFLGKDFDYSYYTPDMKECRVDDAAYVKLKAIGNYYDEDIREEENVVIFYSSLMELPEENKVNNCTLNIFTTLEAERIIYLVRSGYSYNEARNLVKEEIWNQLKESGLFSYYDFLNVKEFEDLDIDDDCLKSLTSYFSTVIINAAVVVEDKSLCSAVLVDFVNNYAATGDLGLSCFNIDVFKKIDSEIFSLPGEEMRLKISATYYKIPFEGGVPHVYKSNVYYGVDTSSFKEELIFPDNSKISLYWPKFKSFTCNGYLELYGKFLADSLNTDNPVEIFIKDVSKSYRDTSINVLKDIKKQDFCHYLWLEREGEYEISVRYGDEQIDLNVKNVLTSRPKED